MLGVPCVFLGSVNNDNNNSSHYRVGADTDSLLTVLGPSHVPIYLIFLLPHEGSVVITPLTHEEVVAKIV